MKRISLVLTVVLALLALPGRAQDVAALEERVKRLNGYVQDLQEANANQKRQIDALVKDLQTLREAQQSTPPPSSASQEDLRDLAKKVQEIEDKRKADRELILREIKDLGKTMTKAPVRSPRSESATPDRSGADLPKEAIEHTIASGDTISAIAAAYSRETGKKVTPELILRANAGLKAERLSVGKKILIPLPDK